MKTEDNDPLAGLEKFLRAARDRGAEMKAFEGLLSSIDGLLADMLAHMEKPKEPHKAPDFSGIVNAISMLKLPAPEVKVTPTFNVPPAPAPVIHVMPAEAPVADSWKELRMSIEQPFGQPPKVVTITKSK